MADVPIWTQLVNDLLGGSIGAGIVGAVTTIVTSRQDKKHKSGETIIANARNHIDTLYLPINISLSHLAEKYEYYQRYRNSYVTAKSVIGSPSEVVTQYQISIHRVLQKDHMRLLQARQAFIAVGNEYLKLMSEIAIEGKDAYLTIQLEERLRSFTAFFQPFMLAPIFQEEAEEAAKLDDEINGDEGFYDINYKISIGTSSFETRFLKDIHDLKSFIKEVTLGG